MKVNKKLLFLVPSAIASIALVPTIGVIGARRISSRNSNTLGDVSNINQDVTNSTTQSSKPLVPAYTNMSNPKLSSRNGPIVFWLDKITSLDWFGAERWTLHMVNDVVFENGFKPLAVNGTANTNWVRSWLNFELDKVNDILYVLSNAKGGNKQYAVAIDVQTGNLIDYYETAEVTSGSAGSKVHSNAFFQIRVLKNGNLAFLGKAGDVATGNNDVIDVVDIKTKQVTRYNGNIDSSIAPKPVADTTLNPGHNYSRSTNIMFNLIPIADNRNLLAYYNLTSKSGTQNDAGAAGGTSEVRFILVDDHMKTIPNATNGWNNTSKLVTNAITDTRNSTITPQCDYHVLLDGRIVTVIYDKLVVIDPTNPNDPKLSISVLENDKWIESWSFDSNETLFFKERNGTNIKQVKLDPDKSNINNPNHVISQYYNLADSPIQDIRDTASSLILYNVYGYIGQIMLINCYYRAWIDYKNVPDQTQIADNKYGLAVAITSNPNATGQGDTKGLLNTDNAFLKSSDFTISQEILNKKLPSEITREDLTFLNGAFLTKNTAKNEDGTLKYEPFVKNVIDDNQKKLKVTLNLDQIPWFVTDGQMPSNIVPLKITKEFDTVTEISSRFSWKNVDQEDYDFKNTLPTKMTIEDIQRVSPLVSTLTSQRQIINGDSYPRTEYKITEKNDVTGKIKIQATYKYLPMELSANTDNIKQYITEKEYTIFKSTDSKRITFVGNNNSDVSQIPELKEIKESNILPSSFLNASKQEYLKFIDINNSAGYPLSKMNITASADDVNGTLTINIDPTAYDSSLSVQTKTYTGLNKTNTYSLRFKDESTIKPNYLPSEINEELFYQNFLTFSGFDSSDFELQLYPNDVTGALTANIILVGNYPNGPTANSDFKLENGQWIARRTFNGFKNIDDYNKEYQLSFKEDGHISLYEVQRLTPSEIKNKLESNTGLPLSDKTYTSAKDFIELFISSKGSKIPNISNNNDVNVNMYINNGGGEITWSITFNNLEGYANPITFLHTVGGFAKGNDVATQDVLTFKNSNQLKLSHSNYFNMLPSQIKSMLENDKQLINNFFLNTPTGGYYTAIQNSNFTLEIVANDTRGTLNIKIKFEKNNNNNIESGSLLEYNQTFTGFMYH